MNSFLFIYLTCHSSAFATDGGGNFYSESCISSFALHSRICKDDINHCKIERMAHAHIDFSSPSSHVSLIHSIYCAQLSVVNLTGYLLKLKHSTSYQLISKSVFSLSFSKSLELILKSDKPRQS